MPIDYTETTCGLQPYNTEWPAAFVAYKAAKQNAGLQMSYAMWQAEYELWIAGQEASGGAFNVTAVEGDTLTASVDGGALDTLTSDLLAGVDVAAIMMDRQVLTPTENGVTLWRKGDDGDTEAEQIASDKITLLTSSFYDGQVVTILKKA